MYETLPFCHESKKDNITALDICCILYLRLLRPGKGKRVQANNNNESLFHQKIKLHILCYNKRR